MPVDRQSGTHISNIVGYVRALASPPADPVIGDEFWDTTLKGWYTWSGNNWIGAAFTTSSTSTTTSTSSSTSTTSTSSSTSTSTTTSTSSSTTTTI